jgi:hypothetical protein
MSLLLLSSNNAAAGDKDSVLTLSSNISAANGSQNNTFIDSSVNNAIVTRVGTPTQGSFSPYGNLWSNYFNGNSITAPANANFVFGTGNYTVECRVNPTLVVPQVIYTQSTSSNTGFVFYLAANGQVVLSTYQNLLMTSGTNYVTANTWNHLAVTSQSSVTRIFINGVLVNSLNSTFNFIDTAVPNVAGAFSSVAGLSGYISDFRILKGTALYTANFTPPTKPLTAIPGTVLLTCQSNRFKDNSINNFAITVAGTPEVTKFSPYVPESYTASTHGGSLYFDGTSYLSTTYTSLGLSNFTMEFWLKTTVGSDQYILSCGTSPDWGQDISVVQYSGQYVVAIGGVTYNYFGNVIVGACVHFAIVRNGTAGMVFINGKKHAVVLDIIATNTLLGTQVFVGQGTLGSWPKISGYVSDLRLVKAAIYTADFTPPTEPLTAIANTELLLLGTNAGIIDSTANTDLVTIGSAQVDTTVKMNGTGSIKFNGTTDYLIAPYSSEFLLFTYPADYTIEACIVPVVSSGQRCIIASYPPGAGVAGNWIIWLNSASKLSFYQYPRVNETLISSLAIPYDVKTHFAVVRASGVTKLYINGVLNSTITTAYDMQNVGNPITIGAYAASAFFKGNISDIKISKTANYTANFTPPTNSF